MEPEIVICSAVRCPDGYIIRGHRHCDAIHTFRGIPRYKNEKRAPSGENQGFVTSRNRYVGREEAYQLQVAAGIPSHDPGGYRGEELYSEDLY